MTDYQKSVTFSIMSAEVESLRDAIRAIRDARQGFLEGVLGGEDIDDCIDSAIALLPESRRSIGKLQADRKTAGLTQKEPLDDILG